GPGSHAPAPRRPAGGAVISERGASQAIPQDALPARRRPAPAALRMLGKHEFAILVVAVLMLAAFSITARNFFSVDNILNITRQVSLWAIVGVGMTFLFIAGEFDISVGSHFGFLVVVLGILAGTYHWNIWLSIGIIFAISLAIGLANGLLTTKRGQPSFIVTLAGRVR